MGGFYPNETILIHIEVLDREKKYMDVDEGYPLVSFFRPNGNKEGEDHVAERKATGIYELQWNIPSSGESLYGTWTVKIVSVKGTMIRKRKASFIVEEF